MKSKKARLLVSAFLTILLFLLDQGTKLTAAETLKGQEDVILIPGVLRLHYLYPENRGIAFGLFQGSVLLFGIVSLLLVLILIWFRIRIPETGYYLPLRICCVLVTAGALGNIADRLGRGYVIDFICFEWIDFPLFNLADMFVVCGAFLAAFLCLFRYREEDDFAFLRPGKKQ